MVRYSTDHISSEITNSRTFYIDMVANENKPVFSVDYVDDGSGYVGENKDRIDDYYSKALAKGYIPLRSQSGPRTRRIKHY